MLQCVCVGTSSRAPCLTVYVCKCMCEQNGGPGRVGGVGGVLLYVCECYMTINKEAEERVRRREAGRVGMNQELHMWKHFEQKEFP